MALMDKSSCRPVENMLHWPAGLLNGPLGEPSMPSGKKGRDRFPMARAEYAMPPSASAFGTNASSSDETDDSDDSDDDAEAAQ